MGITSANCDFLVVGMGIAGLRAAHAFSRERPEGKIIIADLGGGASSEVMGFCAPMGGDDSPEIFIADTMRAGAQENCRELVEQLCNSAADAVNDLESLGVRFDKKADGTYDMLRPLGATRNRVVHCKTTTGKAAMAIYRKILSANENVEFRTSRIVKLFKKENRICGALGFERGKPVLYNTPRVALCCGGAAGLYGFSTWTKVLQGSAYAMASDAGAELIGMNRVQFEPCVAVFPAEIYNFPIITTMLFEGAKLIDARGKSLLENSQGKPNKRELAEIIARAAANGGDCGHGGVWFDFSGVEESLFKGKYSEYYKKLRPLVSDYSNFKVEVKPAAHTTLGGVKIDTCARTNIGGLFAAGEAAGGIHGRDRIGGNAGLEIFVFGKIAGKSAARYDASSCDASNEANMFVKSLKTGGKDHSDTLKKIGEILDSHAGLTRTKSGVKEGLDRINILKNSLLENPPSGLEQICSLQNALRAAELLLTI